MLNRQRIWLLISGIAVVLAGLIIILALSSSGNITNPKRYDLTAPGNQAAFDKLLEANKKLSAGFNFDAAIAEATALQSLGDNVQAIKAWRYFIKNRPTAIQGYWGLGQIYTSQGKYDLAETNWLKAIEVDKPASYENSYIQLADLYKNSLPEKRYKLVQILTQAMSANPTAPNYPLLLAGYYEDTGDFKSAITFYEKALQLDPKNGQKTLPAKIAELKQKI